MKYFVWIDLETTGLDAEKDTILEIATLITDHKFNIVATGPEVVIHHRPETLKNMGDWCQEQHTKSGLLKRVSESQETLCSAEAKVLAFLMRYVGRNKQPMCGNNIGFDRKFLSSYMPDLENYFHYRNIDVSTIKELAAVRRPDILPYPKKLAHRAMDDILESIGELQYYFEQGFMR